MKGTNLCASLILLPLWTAGCHKAVSPPQQPPPPPLQTGKGTLPPADRTPQQEKSETPLASPLPPPSSQSVPLPPPTPKKVRHPKKAPSKSGDTGQTAVASTGGTPATSGTTAQAASPPTVSAPGGSSGSPIGQLTTGDSALGERTKHETADL